jgi:hypothetical protein
MRFALWPQRKRTLRGGVDPREAQARSVEARRRRKQAQGAAPSASHGLDESAYEAPPAKDMGGKRLQTETHTDRGLAQKKAPHASDVWLEQQRAKDAEKAARVRDFFWKSPNRCAPRTTRSPIFPGSRTRTTRITSYARPWILRLSGGSNRPTPEFSRRALLLPLSSSTPN